MCFLTIPTFKVWGGYSKAAAEQHMGGFIPQNLANAAWAFATAGQNDASLFAALATAAEQHMGGFIPQELANTAWAFATVGQLDVQLFTALATMAEQRMGEF